MQLSQLVEAAQAWLAQDPDSETRAELQQLIDAGDQQGLSDRFESRLTFGTAGLRGELGAGPNRMNRVLVSQAALGFANYLKHNFDGAPSVVIGFDGRVNSDVFARDSAEILAGAGIKVLLFDDYVPTPVVAFAVKHRGLSAGIMVTASHNPPRDNGYKVYLGGKNGGGQIVSPADAAIAAQIDIVAATMPVGEMPRSVDIEVGGHDVRDAYIAQTASLVGADAGKPLEVVYTAMHGIGFKTLEAVFQSAGVTAPSVVAEQNEPDGSFPTVAFPNPEEPGALDLAFALASQRSADLVIANDPDADRMAIGLPSPDWQRLTGDQIGLILGEWAAARAVAAGIKGNLACSIVSSSALSKVAQHYGLGFVETLTGFKWITKVDELIFGFEEALGYCVDPQHTPDKDGISAALVMTQIAGQLAASQVTLQQHLDSLLQRYGYFATGQISIRVSDLTIISSTMARLRSNPPKLIAGSAATLTDLSLGSSTLPATDGLRFDLEDGRRVIVRPSGTEPKLKCYLQVVESNSDAATASLKALDDAMRVLLG
jgi:phosphomannomutase